MTPVPAQGPSERSNRRGWLAVVLTQSLLIQAIAFLIRPASSYAAVSIGLPSAALGAVGATFAVLPLALAVPVGRRIETIGVTRLHMLGATLVFAACGLLVVAPISLAALVAANALLGTGHLMCIVSQQTVVANSSTHGDLDAAFGYYTFTASLGQALGPVLIGLIGGASVTPATGPIFWSALGLGSCLLVSSIPGLRENRAEAKRQTLMPASTRALLRVPGLVRAVSVSAIVLAAVDLTVVYLPALGTERGISAAAVGALLGLRGLASMVSRFMLGKMSASLGRTRLMSSSIALSAVSLLAVVIPMPTVFLAFAVLALGLGLGVGQPLTMSWVTQQAPAGQRGQALSLRLAGNRVGQLVLPSVLGVAAAGSGAGGALVAISVVLGASLPFLRGASLD